MVLPRRTKIVCVFHIYPLGGSTDIRKINNFRATSVSGDHVLIFGDEIPPAGRFWRSRDHTVFVVSLEGLARKHALGRRRH